MRGMILATLAVLAVVALAGNDKLIWEDLFAPPYAQVPEITLSMGCVTPELCYLGGGQNGAGFAMYSFNGKAGGNLIQMAEPNMTMMIMAVAAGGTAQAPAAVMGGPGIAFISVGMQYLSGGKTWLPAATPFQLVMAIQDADMSKDGKRVVAIDGGTSGNGLLVSNDGGVSYTFKKVNIPMPNNCTAPGYIKMVSDNTWYLTLGSAPSHKHKRTPQPFPASGKAGETHVHQVNERVSIVRTPDGKIQRVKRNLWTEEPADPSDERCIGYSAQIAKTTDGGNTWTVLYQSTGDFSVANIDCSSETNCVVSGFGKTTSVILSTQDGKTFKQVVTLNSNPNKAYALSAVAFASATEVWVGGGVDTQTGGNGMFYVSNDGGSSFSEYQYLQPNIEEITSLTFTEGVGYATGLTSMRDSTILKYAKQPFYGYFTQSQCISSTCAALCQNMTFPQGTCIPAQGGSAIALCHKDGIHQRMYQTTSCIGSYNTTIQPINKCLKDQQGSYFENFCNTDGGVQGGKLRL